MAWCFPGQLATEAGPGRARCRGVGRPTSWSLGTARHGCDGPDLGSSAVASWGVRRVRSGSVVVVWGGVAGAIPLALV